MVQPNKKNRFGSKAKDIGVAFDEAKEEVKSEITNSIPYEKENIENKSTTKKDSDVEIKKEIATDEIKEEPKVEIVKEEIIEQVADKPIVTKKKKAEEVKDDTNNSFVLVKKGEKDIKMQKIFNLKYSNILKIKEIKEATGLSESAIMDYLIEQSTKLLKIE